MATRDDLIAALLAYKRKYGHPEMRQLLEETAFVTSMDQVPERDFDAVIAETKRRKPKACLTDANVGTKPMSIDEIDSTAIYERWNKNSAVTPESTDAETIEDIDPVAIYAKWNSARRRDEDQ